MNSWKGQGSNQAAIPGCRTQSRLQRYGDGAAMRRQRPSVAHQHDTAPTTQPARSPTKGRQHDGKGLEGGQHCKGGSQPRGEGELTVQQGRRNSGWPATPGLQHLGGNTWATAPRSAAGSMQGCTAQRGSVQAQLRWHAWPRALPCQRQAPTRGVEVQDEGVLLRLAKLHDHTLSRVVGTHQLRAGA